LIEHAQFAEDAAGAEKPQHYVVAGETAVLVGQLDAHRARVDEITTVAERTDSEQAAPFCKGHLFKIGRENLAFGGRKGIQRRRKGPEMYHYDPQINLKILGTRGF
jgi:hypothetical protein